MTHEHSQSRQKKKSQVTVNRIYHKKKHRRRRLHQPKQSSIRREQPGQQIIRRSQ
jgi:hypothetical protein